MLFVFGLKNCKITRQAREWLEEQGVQYQFIDLHMEPFTREELRELQFKVGLDVLINRNSSAWEEINADELKDKDELFEEVLEHQEIIERPVFVYDEAVMVGFDKEALSVFIDQTGDKKRG